MSDLTDRARELLKEIHKWYFTVYCEERQMFLLTSALQRERNEAAERGVRWFDKYCGVGDGSSEFAKTQLRFAIRDPEPHSEKGGEDWPEDATLENGNYQCTCLDCGRVFIGHKRRVQCKMCARLASSTRERDEAAGRVRKVYQVRIGGVTLLTLDDVLAAIQGD